MKDFKELFLEWWWCILESIYLLVETKGWGIGIVSCDFERIDVNSLFFDLNCFEVEFFVEVIEVVVEDSVGGIVMVDVCDVDEGCFMICLIFCLGS